MAETTPTRWYASGWFLAWTVVAVVFGLMALAWGLTSLPDPADLAPGDDTSDVDGRYAMFWVFIALALAGLGVAVVGSRIRARWAALRRSAREPG